MPKRQSSSTSSYMECKSRKLSSQYDGDSLVCSKNIRSSSRFASRGAKAAKPTKTRKSYLQKSDTDTFKFLPEDDQSPTLDSRRNAGIANYPSSFPLGNKINQSQVTSKTPENQTIDSSKIQQPSKILLNRRKPKAVTPSTVLQSKAFISVTGEQMTKFLQVIGKCSSILLLNSCLWQIVVPQQLHCTFQYILQKVCLML